MNLRVFYLYKTVGFGWLRCIKFRVSPVKFRLPPVKLRV